MSSSLFAIKNQGPQRSGLYWMGQRCWHSLLGSAMHDHFLFISIIDAFYMYFFKIFFKFILKLIPLLFFLASYKWLLVILVILYAFNFWIDYSNSLISFFYVLYKWILFLKIKNIYFWIIFVKYVTLHKKNFFFSLFNQFHVCLFLLSFD